MKQKNNISVEVNQYHNSLLHSSSTVERGVLGQGPSSVLRRS